MQPAQASTASMPLRGFVELLRLVLRRDRMRLLLWFAGIVGVVAVSVQSIIALYDTPAGLASYARLVRDNAAMIVQSGPGYGLDDPSVGAVMINEVSIWALITVALMSVFMMVRHTRAEEESERAELVRSAPVGRHAQLAAALVGVALANLLVAVGVGLAFVVYGIPVVGSMAFAASLVGVGCVFAGVAAVTAQVASGARAASALGGGTIAVAFVLRAIGDVGDGRLSWVSPIGWSQAIRAFAHERWWVLVLPLVTTVALVATAVSLQLRRDLGAGLVAQRDGRAEATRWLSTPLGLAGRLHRATIIGWTVGMALIGFFYGIVADQAESIFDENPELADFLAQLGQGSITDVFLATAMLWLALMATGFTVSAVLRMRTEELAVRADPILSTPVSRRSWVAGHLVCAVGGTVLMMAVTGVAVGTGNAAVAGDLAQIPRLLGAALVTVPAMLVMAGATTALHGLGPRWAPLAWGFFAFAVVIGMLGSVLDLPQWVLDLSPFQHVPAVPASPLQMTPIAALCAVAALLVGLGIVAFEHRDIG